MGVGVGGADVAGGAEDFADVLGEVPAVGEPGAVLADGKGAGGDGLGGVPRDEPEGRVGGAGEVAAGDLQVAVVNVALMKRHVSIDGHFFGGAAAIHHHRLSGDVRRRYRAVAGVFRAIVIHHPIRRGQASFIHGNHFFCKRGGELRDELLLHAHQRAAGGVVSCCLKKTVINLASCIDNWYRLL